MGNWDINSMLMQTWFKRNTMKSRKGQREMWLLCSIFQWYLNSFSQKSNSLEWNHVDLIEASKDPTMRSHVYPAPTPRWISPLFSWIRRQRQKIDGLLRHLVSRSCGAVSLVLEFLMLEKPGAAKNKVGPSSPFLPALHAACAHREREPERASLRTFSGFSLAHLNIFSIICKDF